MENNQETNSGAHVSAVETIYELRYRADWPELWQGCMIGKLGDLIRKHKPVAIVRIR